jgi:hypothetical protein
MRAAGLTIAGVVAVLLPSGVAYATSYQIGPVSQQVGPSRASVGASVGAASQSPGAPGARNVSSESLGEPTSSGSGGEGGEGEGQGESAPSRINAETCQSLPASAIPCYGVVPLPPEAPAKAGATPAVNPAVLAAAAASRLSLLAGRIEASPSSQTTGLTGAASWFWLSPPPTPQSLSVAARAEHVTVTAAVGTVQWDFGDGNTVSGGPGVAYRPGSSPSAAIRHVYETRCLPGDRGHDPNVSSSCGPGGYEVHATIEWRISFQASGPIATGGPLPTRSTQSTLSYPVSEARAFLTKASGG